LIALCHEHAKFAKDAVSSVSDKHGSSENICSHLDQTLAYIRSKAGQESGSVLGQIKIPGEAREVENTPPTTKPNAVDNISTAAPKVEVTRGE
jgi:hypothetical protein